MPITLEWRINMWRYVLVDCAEKEKQNGRAHDQIGADMSIHRFPEALIIITTPMWS